MRALVCAEFGGVENLRVDDWPDPGPPGEGQIRIRVAAAGVNFADLLIVAGKYQVKPPRPFVPGFEVAGAIEAVGPGAGRLKPGDRVMALLDHGGFAEMVIVAAKMAFPISETLTDTQAAGFPIAYGTSYLGLVEQARLLPGEILLVHGAAGGVGLTAVEIGKALGAKVVATAGGKEKCAVALAHGADHAIDYSAEDIRERVKALVGGVDVVFDPVGGATFEASLRVANWHARLLIIGFAGGAVQSIPANILLVRNVAALGFFFGSYRQHRPDLVASAFASLDRMCREARLRPLVCEALDLADFAWAFDGIRSRRAIGKIVLKP